MKAISHFILIFTVGMAIGYFIDKDKTISSIDIVESAHIKKPVESSVAVESALQIQGDLETEVKALQARIAFLEAQLLETQQTDDSASDNIVQNDRHEEKLSVENLLKAGVTEMMAQDIVDRMSQHEFQLLELHDRARREGYLNTSRYAKERRELMTTSPSLKAAIGDDTYDRYLYITGQNNRVVVTSVMSDSPADQLGVQADDIILNYANEKVLSWHDLRKLTSQGSYGEYVNLNVLRDGRLLNILVPRGPLGVKLSPTILDPSLEYNY